MVLYPSFGQQLERLPRVRLPMIKSLSTITHGIIPQCWSTIGRKKSRVRLHRVKLPKMELPRIMSLWVRLPRARLAIIGIPMAQPSECGQQRTLNSVNGHTAAQLQSNGNLAV